MTRNVSQLGSDVVTLVELQAELLQVDLREWAQGFAKSVVAMAAALVLLLSSMPVALISLGYFISQMSDLSLAASMLIAAGVGILLGAILAGVGVWMLKREQSMLHRFRRELKHNVAWLKQVLSNPASATAPTPTHAAGVSSP
jgi:sensor c-di-GMP phosphodiesterase-like protein